jgi:hypothetical protein
MSQLELEEDAYFHIYTISPVPVVIFEFLGKLETWEGNEQQQPAVFALDKDVIQSDPYFFIE